MTPYRGAPRPAAVTLADGPAWWHPREAILVLQIAR